MISEQQYGVMQQRTTTDEMFTLRVLMKEYREGQKKLCGSRESMLQGDKGGIMVLHKKVKNIREIYEVCAGHVCRQQGNGDVLQE